MWFRKKQQQYTFDLKALGADPHVVMTEGDSLTIEGLFTVYCRDGGVLEFLPPQSDEQISQRTSAEISAKYGVTVG